MKARLLLLLLSLLIKLPDLSAQNAPEPYAADWHLLDSLLSNGLPQSAAAKAQQVYTRAQEKKQPVQQLKAQLYLLYSLQNEDRTDSPQRALALAEREARTQPFPLSNIWHSYAGELYLRYFQSNSWRIQQRTAQAGTDSAADISEWSAGRILQTAAAHYRASLSRAGELAGTSLAAYQPLIVRGVNSAGLRPTLFDLLSFRALDFFETGYQELTRPADVFTIDDVRYFAPTADFVALQIVTTDSASSEAQALRVYQQLLRLHRDDSDPAALIDAELHRLQFVYNHAALEGKDGLYENALMELAVRKKGNDGAAEALYRVQAARYYREGSSGSEENPRRASGLPKIRQDLDAIIREYPGSEGAVHARDLIRSILSADLNLQAEEVVLPGAPSKVLLSYRNVEIVYFRLLTLDEEASEQFRTGQDSLFKKHLARTKPRAVWQVALPGGDYSDHRTETGLEALPLGNYLLLVSSSPDWSSDSALLKMVHFQVSGLSLVNIIGLSSKAAGVVADRKTGVPLAGVSILLERSEFDSKTKKSETKNRVSLSGKNGFFEIEQGGYYRRMIIALGGDTLRHYGYFNYSAQERSEADDEADTTLWFFTDRAIYRPGQEVFFKGIVIRTAGGSSRIVPGYRGAVLLSDANSINTDSLSVAANEFGSFQGSFRLPAGSLTGDWSLHGVTLKGAQSIRVEEYKRPRFEVRFDSFSGSYPLNREVRAQGSAQAFSGAVIDGAQVRYKVRRQAEYPWFGSGFGRRYGYSPKQEIGNGTAITDAGGRFVIRFNTTAPLPLDTGAVYRYEISAEITDGAGETRRGETVLRAGYRNLLISTSYGAVARLADVDSFRIYTYNLNQVFQPADITVTIEALKSPAKPLRARLWKAPDRFVMDSAAFKALFPNDEYREESNPEHWARRQVYSGMKRSREDGRYGLPRSAFAQNGMYRLLLGGKDSNGRYVETEHFITLQDTSLPKVSAAALSLAVGNRRPAPGAPSRAVVSTAFDTATVFRIAKSNSREILSVQTLRGGEPADWRNEALAGKESSLLLLVWTIRDNRLYQDQEYVVPAAAKDLTVTWASHRDKLQPGAAETWTLKIRGKAGDKVAAEMAASLYDASLDQFVHHDWWQQPLSDGRVQPVSLQPVLFDVAYASGSSYRRMPLGTRWEKRYDQLMTAAFSRYALRRKMLFSREQDMAIYPEEEERADGAAVLTGGVAARYGSYSGAIAAAPRLDYNVSGPMLTGTQMEVPAALSSNVYVNLGGRATDVPGSGDAAGTPVTPRKNLRETAFFFPQLRTDDSGNVTFSFSLPEALTQWRLLAFAHTKDLQTGRFEGTVRTQKDLMVTPGIPRFLRQGDTITLSAKITNLADRALAGTARLEVLDAATLQPLHGAFRLTKTEQPFTTAAAGSTAVSWNLTVPLSRYEPVVIRITARAGTFTDGEDNTLPVLTNRTLVTETQSLWLTGNGVKTFTLSPLAQSLPRRGSGEGTVSPHALTVEYTANPAWLALQALPYLADYPYECAEQTFNRYYANALAAHILARAPKLKAIFARWQQDDTAALLSKLELNPELKSVLLEETPWVLEAADERAQRAGIARLFNASRAASGSASALRKLRDMQSEDGSFPWFSGGSADRYITQYIAVGLARMQQLGVKLSGEGKNVLAAAQHYLDEQLVRDYREARRNKINQQAGPLQVQQLYLSSLVGQHGDTALANARRYFSDQTAQHWSSFNPYLKGLAYLALKADGGYPQTVPIILQSLRETAIRDEEQGLWWIRPGAGYYWHEAPIEAQALLIECFAAAGDSAMVSDARRWLLKQKQAQHWSTTKATADACYALLLTGADWTGATPQVSIRLGDYRVSADAEKIEAGTGYFKRSIPREQISASMANIAVEVKGSTTTQPGWGAIYYQYFADMDAVGSSTDSSRPRAPLSVKKQFFAVRNTKSGEVLEAITTQQPLKVGDKVRVRIVVTADRQMDYVHLKDSRASCLEPADVLSGYRWQDGLGYYQSTRDGSTNFFIDRLRRGTAVFEYSLFVTSRGDFGAGLATAQCLYAPEFAAHSQGARIEVR